MTPLEDMKPEVQALVRRGQISVAETQGLRCTADEWHAVYLRLSDDALVHFAERALANCPRVDRGDAPASAYAVQVIFLPEALRRIQRLRRATGAFAAVAEDVLRRFGDRVAALVAAHPSAGGSPPR
jgi:hypothetical protein